MTECILIKGFKQFLSRARTRFLSSLNLSLSDVGVWSQLSEYTSFDSCHARVGETKVSGSSLPTSVASCITSFSTIHLQLHMGMTTFCNSA